MKSDLPKGFPNQDFLEGLGERPLPFDYAWRREDGMPAGHRQGETDCDDAAQASTDYATCGRRAFYLASFISRETIAAARLLA